MLQHIQNYNTNKPEAFFFNLDTSVNTKQRRFLHFSTVMELDWPWKNITPVDK
jgi:hypothetical protein